MRPIMRTGLAGLIGLLVVIGSLYSTAGAYTLTTADRAFLSRKIVARWHITGQGQVEEAYRRGLDVWEEHLDRRARYFTIMLSDSQLVSLRQAGYQIEVMNDDWYKTFKEAAVVPNGGFRTPDQCYALMDSIHNNHPAITTAKFSIGFTYEGREMWAMKISDNPDIDEDEPEVLFDGMHHAREPIGMEVCLETMRRLTDGYGVDTLITRLVNEREIYFIPIVNVDGYQYNVDLDTAGGGQWRKNREDNPDRSFGVDINRNYGYKWGYNNTGSSPTPAAETYRGPAAFSEPETQNMRAFINSRHFVFVLNYHSYSNLYLWAWGYDYIYTPDEAFFNAVGDSLATYNGFTPMVGWGLYPTNGDSDDWGYGATGEHTKIYSITPEVGSEGDGFWPPVSRIPTLIEENQGPNLVIIDLAQTPERIYPPAMPAWLTPGTVSSPNYSLVWSDPGGPNGAVAFRLEELFGPHIKTDNAEGGMVDWTASGFTLSTTRTASGTHSYDGGHTNSTNSRLLTNEYRRLEPGDSLRCKVWYDIEDGWDYAYAEVSTDGVLFNTLPGNVTTNNNPHGQNRGNGITGSSGGVFVNAAFSLAPYVGQDALIRFSYQTDQAVLGSGFYVDDIGPLLAYDSVKTLAAAMPETTFAVTGKAIGDYRYRVLSTDAQGQKSPRTPVKIVTVYFLANGDMNNDGTLDILDIVQLIDFVFSGGQGAVLPGAEECDCIGGVDILDIVFLVDHVFSGGPAPNCP